MAAGEWVPQIFKISKLVIAVQIAKTGGYRYENGFVYVGDWNKNGAREGQGHLSFPDGTRYDGRFEENVFCGLGVLTFPDGAKLGFVIN